MNTSSNVDKMTLRKLRFLVQVILYSTSEIMSQVNSDDGAKLRFAVLVKHHVLNCMGYTV